MHHLALKKLLQCCSNHCILHHISVLLRRWQYIMDRYSRVHLRYRNNLCTLNHVVDCKSNTYRFDFQIDQVCMHWDDI